MEVFTAVRKFKLSQQKTTNSFPMEEKKESKKQFYKQEINKS